MQKSALEIAESVFEIREESVLCHSSPVKHPVFPGLYQPTVEQICYALSGRLVLIGRGT